jgi:hypothetical protein
MMMRALLAAQRARREKDARLASAQARVRSLLSQLEANSAGAGSFSVLLSESELRDRLRHLEHMLADDEAPTSDSDNGCDSDHADAATCIRELRLYDECTRLYAENARLRAGLQKHMRNAASQTEESVMAALWGAVRSVCSLLADFFRRLVRYHAADPGVMSASIEFRNPLLATDDMRAEMMEDMDGQDGNSEYSDRGSSGVDDHEDDHHHHHHHHHAAGNDGSGRRRSGGDEDWRSDWSSDDEVVQRVQSHESMAVRVRQHLATLGQHMLAVDF